MSKTISKFRFKRFSVSHHRSSMKVGVDGVLIGCWADVKAVRKILDVGTGCGLIALIMAQRAPEAEIDAIDIDSPSIEEAMENVQASLWPDRITVINTGFSELAKNPKAKFDLIISNPPYFDSGVIEIHTAREKARHQGELSPSVILKEAAQLLNQDGSVAMVVPTEISEELEAEAASAGYSLERKCLVRGHREAPFKRTLLQWRHGKEMETKTDLSQLTLEVAPSIPTDEYRDLCKDFYLKF